MQILFEKQNHDYGNHVLIYRPYVVIDGQKYYVNTIRVDHPNSILDFPNIEIKRNTYRAMNPVTFEKVSAHTVSFIKLQH